MAHKGHSPSLNNLPYETTWLLEFVNLGRKIGKLCPPDYALDKLKRKPDPSQADELTTSFFTFTGFRGIDKDNNIWTPLETSDGTLIAMKVKGFPVAEFKKLLEKGMPGKTESLAPEDYDICEILRLWVEMKRAFYWIAKENLSKKRSYRPDFLKPFFYSGRLFDQLMQESELMHDDLFENSLTKAIAVCFFNFYFHQKELRERLRCCYCCGRFFIPQRKKKFCSTQCNKKFHRLPKDKLAELAKQYRSYEKEKRQKREYKEMYELLKGYNYSDSAAKREAYEWIYEKGKPLTAYNKAFSL